MVITNLIEYLKNMANDHIEIQGFVTGEEYEQNHSLRVYPLLWMKLPVRSVIDQAADTMTLEFTLGVYSNTIKDADGNIYIIREDNVTTPNNQIDYVGIIAQDMLMDNTFAIMSQVLSKMMYDIEEGLLALRMTSNALNTVERYSNDDVYGTECLISIVVPNPYKCNLQNYFNSLI